MSKLIKTILNKVDYEGRNPDLDFTVDKDIVISAERELELMDKGFQNRKK